jgi:hypothetical protein
MRILALDRPAAGATLAAYQPHILAEVRHTWGAYKSGLVRDIYFRQDRPGVAIFLECADAEAAKAALAELPLVRAGLLDFDVIPLGPFVNWELLFAAE